MKAVWSKYRLNFNFTAVTSRERLTVKDTYFIKIWDPGRNEIHGYGEAALFKGLSCDDRPDYEEKLGKVCRDIDRFVESPSLLAEWPSIRFAVESAKLDFSQGGKHILFPSDWTAGISTQTINGLIWMGDSHTMRQRITNKIAEGFSCIKIKIGGIDFEKELKLLGELRDMAPEITIRLDANGAFNPDEAVKRLQDLSVFNIHSIEQPIKAGQWDAMRNICQKSPIPIALDEELIGINDPSAKFRMLDSIHPHYIILKPTLCGGFQASEEWIEAAGKLDIGWWATSALESNVGLNAIAQCTATFESEMPQGLGTGQLYTNNIPSPLTLESERLGYDPTGIWQIPSSI